MEFNRRTKSLRPWKRIGQLGTEVSCSGRSLDDETSEDENFQYNNKIILIPIKLDLQICKSTEIYITLDYFTSFTRILIIL